MTPSTLNEQTLAKEILAELDSAIALPADDRVYSNGQVGRRHRPATRARCEQVLVDKYGVTWRRRLVAGKWQAVEQIGGRIDS